MKLRPAVVGLTFLSFASQASAATLFSLAGPQPVTGGGDGIAIVSTDDDTDDWITAGGYHDGSSTVPLFFTFTAEITNNAGETGTGGFFTGFQLFDGTGGAGERFAVGNTWGSLIWGGFRGPGDFDLTSTPAYEVGTPATFVFKIDQQADTATIWFNPDTSLSEAAQPSSIVTLRPDLGINDQFTSIRLRAGNDAGATTFSDISIQNTSPFVPEPSALMLAALTGITLLRRRR